MRYPFLAEIAGFELARRNIYRPTAFRVRTLQPLGYISIEKRDTLFFLYKNTCLVYHIFRIGKPTFPLINCFSEFCTNPGFGSCYLSSFFPTSFSFP